MKKLIKYFSYTLSILAGLSLIQATASAADGKSPEGSLTGAQVVGGLLVLLLVIMVPLINGGKSANIRRHR
jgi:hypothetical protein